MGPSESGKDQVVGPSSFGIARRKPAAAGTPAPARHVLLAQAYTELQRGKFDDAAAAFDNFASYYNIESDAGWGFALPYFALAAAQSGDKLELEKFVDAKLAEKHNWGVLLAKAVFEALHDRPDSALEWLDKAFRGRIATGQWPLSTAFEYADLCVRLYDLKHDERYREHALAWARSHQRIEPAQAWAYALVAHYGHDVKEQTQSLAKPLYLDPQSHWAGSAAKELKESVAKLPQDKPFIILRPSNDETKHL